MICRNNKSGAHFNYEFVGENLVNVWNPDKKYGTNGYSKMIMYDTWLKEYTIIDKWRTIKAY
jgi:hypothetical protein